MTKAQAQAMLTAIEAKLDKLANGVHQVAREVTVVQTQVAQLRDDMTTAHNRT